MYNAWVAFFRDSVPIILAFIIIVVVVAVAARFPHVLLGTDVNKNILRFSFMLRFYVLTFFILSTFISNERCRRSM